jgi:type I restriction enzyme S subunit
MKTMEPTKDTKRNLLNGWRWVKLGEVCVIQNGFAFDSDRFQLTGGIPLIRIRDLKTNIPSINYDGYANQSYLVHVGDLLIGMDGEFRAYRWEGPDALLNQRVCRLFPDTNHLARIIHEGQTRSWDSLHHVL